MKWLEVLTEMMSCADQLFSSPKLFRQRCEQAEDDQRSGRPSKAKNDEKLEKWKTFWTLTAD